MELDLEARKELRKLINKLLRHENVEVTVANKIDTTVIDSKKAAVVFNGQKIVIETFERPPKLFKDRDLKNKI